MTKPAAKSRDLPLCVDLDGTLIKTDLLIEAILQLAKDRPLDMLKLPFWLLKGKAAFKAEIFSRVDLDVEALPYNEAFVNFLREERARGRQLVLSTATSRRAAEAVAKQVGLFSRVIASDEHVNLAGRKKAEALVAAFGEKSFSYAANDDVDLDVWKAAGEAYVVQPTPGLARKVEAVCAVAAVHEDRKSLLLLMLKAMRPHQWAKNILIFAPVVFAKKLTNIELLTRASVAFLTFALVASSVYIINDLLDLNSDRRHLDNRRRPFASGDLPLKYGFVLAPLLFIGGMVAALSYSPLFFGVVLGYFVVTSLYSVRLKQLVMADVLILAGLYAWRVFAGAVATEIKLTSWFLAFFGFLFLSLALVKRCSELILTQRRNGKANARRGYTTDDLPLLMSFGAASGYLAVLVLALYVNAELNTGTYLRPQYLWFLCPMFLYWISRMWVVAHRGLMTTDPLVFSLKDRVSYMMISFMACIWLIASGYI